MRLRLNTTLRAALIAAITAVGFTALSAQAEVAFSGTILTWNGDMFSKNDAAYGQYYKTTFDGTSFSVDESQVVQPSDNKHWPDVQAVIGNKDLQPQNTLRFDSTHGQGRKTVNYTFNPFSIGGIVVDTGAIGFSIQSSGSYDRNFWLGSSDASPAYSMIKENFSLNKTSGTGTLHLRGTQTFDVASDKIFTLKSNNDLDFASALTVTGGGTVAFDGPGKISMTADSSLEIQSGSTVTFSAAVTGLSHTITNAGTLTFASDTVTLGTDLSGFDDFSATYEDYTGVQTGNGFLSTVECSVIKNTGAGQSNLSKVVFGGNTYNLDKDGKVVFGDDVDYTTYYLNTDGATVDLAQAITQSSSTLSTVVTAGKTGTITVNSDSILGTLNIASGSTATVNGTANLTLNGLTGTGALVKDGNAKLTLGAQLNASNTTSITVNAGELAITQKTAGDTIHDITVAQGATVSVAGANNSDFRLRFTLDGGTLAYTGSTTGGSVQNVQITLTKDSYISGTGNFYMLAGNYGVTNLILNNRKLIKQGNNTVTLYNTHVGEGTIEVQGGMIDFSSAHNDPEVSADIILNGGAIAGTLNMMKNLSLTAAVNTTLSSGVTVKGSGKTLTMGTEDEAALTLTQGLTVSSGTVKVNGDVTISGKSLDLSGNNASTGKVEVSGDSILNVKGGMWMGSNAGIDIAKDGTLKIANLNIVGKETKASVTVSEANQQYGVGKAAFIIDNATVTATGNVTIGNTLTNSDVVTGANEVTLNSNAANVIVSDGGSFTKGNGFKVDSVTVEGTGTVSGMDISDVTLESGATATFADEYYVVAPDDNVYMFNSDSPVVIENIGNTSAKYTGLHQEGMKVTADMLSSSADGVTVQNTVAVTSISHEGGALTLQHVDADALQNVEVAAGVLSMQNITNVTLTEMDIASGATVQAVYTDDQMATVEGTVTISQALTAGGGTLLANLTLVGGSTLNVNGGDTNALTLGSMLTFDLQDGLVNLDNETIAALNQLGNGESLDLIVAAQDTGLSYTGAETGMWYNQLFNRVDGLQGDYTVYANDGAFGLTKFSSVPEPTTGTLSLLALAALAARRRRK